MPRQSLHSAVLKPHSPEPPAPAVPTVPAVPAVLEPPAVGAFPPAPAEGAPLAPAAPADPISVESLHAASAQSAPKPRKPSKPAAKTRIFSPLCKPATPHTLGRHTRYRQRCEPNRVTAWPTCEQQNGPRRVPNACPAARLFRLGRTVGRRGIDRSSHVLLGIVRRARLARVPAGRKAFVRHALVQLVVWSAAIRANRVSVGGRRRGRRVVERRRAKRRGGIPLPAANPQRTPQQTRNKSAHERNVSRQTARASERLGRVVTQLESAVRAMFPEDSRTRGGIADRVPQTSDIDGLL